jgi:hypothetical protein
MPDPDRPGGGDCGDCGDGGDGGFRGQCGHVEAVLLGDKANSQWRSCDRVRGDRDARSRPVVDEADAGGMTWHFEAPLARVADFDGGADGSDCGAGWVFPGGERRRVFLRAGYRFYADRPFVDRVYAIRKPAGNPPVFTRYSAIGGLVMTSWPDPMPAKAPGNAWRFGPEADRPSRVYWGQPCEGGNEIPLAPGVWTAVAGGARRPRG